MPGAPWRIIGGRWDDVNVLALEFQGFQQTVSPDSATQVVEKVAMLQALAELSPADREILLLTAWDGLDAEGVAQVLRISPTAARARLSRARHRLVAKFDAPPAELPTPRLATEGN
ncbi:MAG: sigma factor-like helix-turn-helix DNA-binding protein [Propionicimonas sp.]